MLRFALGDSVFFFPIYGSNEHASGSGHFNAANSTILRAALTFDISFFFESIDDPRRPPFGKSELLCNILHGTLLALGGQAEGTKFRLG